MSVNELIFNKARFFNVDENSIYKAIPRYVTVPKGVRVYYPPVIDNSGGNIRPIDHLGDSFIVNYEIEESCLGVIDWGNFGQYYQILYTGNASFSEIMYVKVQDVTNVKWGGKTLVNHFWQRLRHAFISRNEVRACL